MAEPQPDIAAIKAEFDKASPSGQAMMRFAAMLGIIIGSDQPAEIRGDMMEAAMTAFRHGIEVAMLASMIEAAKETGARMENVVGAYGMKAAEHCERANKRLHTMLELFE